MMIECQRQCRVNGHHPSSLGESVRGAFGLLMATMLGCPPTTVALRVSDVGSRCEVGPAIRGTHAFMMAAFFLGQAQAEWLLSDCFEDEEGADGTGPDMEDVKLTDCLPEFRARVEEAVGAQLDPMDVLKLAKKLRIDGILRVADAQQMVERSAARVAGHHPVEV